MTMAESIAVNKTPKSSVIIMPQEGCQGWDQIQAIREKHDKSYVRWMPHINMLYPFLEDANDGQNFQDAATKLTEALKNFKPFTVKFSKDSFGYFSHSKSCTLWLKPLTVDTVSTTDVVDTVTKSMNDLETAESRDGNVQNNSGHETGDLGAHGKGGQKGKKSKKNKGKFAPQKASFIQADVSHHPEVVNLQSCLHSAFPMCDDVNNISGNGFQPHLSLGQFKRNEIDEYASKFREEWNDFEFKVNEVFLISRKDFHDPFHIRHCVRLGGSE